MARYPLKDKQAEFTKSAMKLVGSKGWEDALSELWATYLEEFSETKTENTQKLYISKFRTTLREAFDALGVRNPKRKLVDAAINCVAFPEGLNKRLYEGYQASVADQSRNLTVVKDYKALVRLFTQMLDDPDIRVKALAIMFLTGRRFFEVLTMADFKAVVEQTENGRIRAKYVLEFSGQAKTREAEGTKFGEAYRIPCLAPAQDIIAALLSIRNSTEGQKWVTLDSTQMNAAESGRMNQLLRGLLASEAIDENDLVESLTIKQLRALYAEISFALFAPNKVSKAAYFADKLGHSRDDIKTSLSYMDYVLGDERNDRVAAQKEIKRLIAADKAQQAKVKAEPAPVRDGEVIDDTDNGE